MAKAKTESTALATREEETSALALVELGDFFDSVSVTGMEEVGGEDIKLAVKLFNMSGLDENKNQRRKNVFFDNITEQESATLECVFLGTHKTNRYDRFDNAKKETELLCSSDDRITGTMADGTQRACRNCPDSGWFKDEEGKPMRKCGEVHNVIGLERLTQKPFITRFKKTSLRPWRNHLMQHHFGARIGRDGRPCDVPLFAFACSVSLEMSDAGTHAVPVFTRGELLKIDEIKFAAESAKAYRDTMQDVLRVADKADTKHASTESNISSDDFAE